MDKKMELNKKLEINISVRVTDMSEGIPLVVEWNGTRFLHEDFLLTSEKKEQPVKTVEYRKEENQTESDTEENKRVCSKCGIEKPLTEFHRCKTGRLGKKSICIDCTKEYLKDYRKGIRIKERKELGRIYQKKPLIGENVLIEISELLKKERWVKNSEIKSIVKRYYPAAKKGTLGTYTGNYMHYLSKKINIMERPCEKGSKEFKLKPKVIVEKATNKSNIIESDGSIPLTSSRLGDRKFWQRK